MKSLVLKDLYNIGHNAKSMLFILVVLAVGLVPTSGAGGYMIMCAVLCSMMTVTTFTFDNMAGWTPYALVMPVTRREIVLAKYLVLAVFCTVGDLFGLAAGGVCGFVMGEYTVGPQAFAELAVLALAGWAVAFAMGSVAIPLVYRFGAERARVLLLVAFLIPAALCAAVYGVLWAAGVPVSDGMLTALLCASPLLALVWGAAMYRVACGIFVRAEC